MTEEPLTWHYGLMAEFWAEFVTDTLQLDFLRGQIEQFGQPALDLGCGSGRLLVPMLQAGIDIDGCDISADMLAKCRENAVAAGRIPHLYAQPMHGFSLPRKYRTIYICDSFGLAGSRQKDLQTLQRCYEHLEEGGALVVNIQAEYTDPEAWARWLPEYRQALPEPWPEPRPGRPTSDGGELRSFFRTLEINPLEQYLLLQTRLEKWMNGKPVTVEEYRLRDNVYFKPELLLMLQTAGFRQVTVTGDYTHEPATADHQELIFTAVRQES